MVNEQAVSELLSVAQKYIPTSALEFLEAIRDGLPALAEANSLEAEKTAVVAIGNRWPAWDEWRRSKYIFGPIIRDLLHFTPEQREAIVDAALSRIRPAAESEVGLEEMDAAVKAALKALSPREKAILRTIDELGMAGSCTNWDFCNIWRDIVRDASIDVLRADPTMNTLVRAYNLAETVNKGEL